MTEPEPCPATISVPDPVPGRADPIWLDIQCGLAAGHLGLFHQWVDYDTDGGRHTVQWRHLVDPETRPPR